MNTGDWATVIAFCTCFNGPLLMYQMSFNSLPYFQRYALNKLFIENIIKGSNFVIIGDRVVVLALCNFLHGPLSVYQASFSYLQYF